jgi:mannitol/fructose-specific phosphotransferase system IIA component (Ntr-type)
MNVCDILNVDKIKVDFKTGDKFGVINELVDLIAGDPKINDIDETRSAIIDREEIQSTGVGSGFAIPHAKTDGVKDMIAAFGRLPAPIEFESIDKQPVNLVFLMVAQESAVGPHIKMLSRISRLMSSESFRESLIKAGTSEEIYELFKTEENNLLETT